MQGCYAVLRMLWCAHLLAAAVVAARRAARAARQQLASRRPHSMRCCCCRRCICRSCSCSARRGRRIRRPLHALRRSHFCGCLQRCRCYLVHPGVEAACVVAAASAAALPGCTRRLVPTDQATKRSTWTECSDGGMVHEAWRSNLLPARVLCDSMQPSNRTPCASASLHSNRSASPLTWWCSRAPIQPESCRCRCARPPTAAAHRGRTSGHG